jgi:hypothetical protein
MQIKDLIKVLKKYKKFVLSEKTILKDLVKRIVDPLLDRLLLIEKL